MKVSFNSRVNKFQEGGAIESQQPEMTAEAPATQPAEETNQDPMYQILHFTRTLPLSPQYSLNTSIDGYFSSICCLNISVVINIHHFLRL